MSDPTARRVLAFAGAGHIAEVHALAAARLGLAVGPVASRTEERAASFVAAHGGVAVPYSALPAGADLVVVSTPPARHAHDAVQALQAGTSALVEKPLATTLADADRIVEAADSAASAGVGYAENLLFAPLVRRFLAERNTLGPLSYLEARLLSPPPDWGGFLDPAWGGGAVFDSGAHPIAVVLRAALPAVPVAVRGRLQASPDGATDIGGEVDIDFDSGLHAHVVASWAHDERVRDFQAASSTGVVRAELLPERALERDGQALVLAEPDPDPVSMRVVEMGFVDQLRWASAMLVAGHLFGGADAAFGRRVLEIICAAYASAGQDGRSVTLPFTGDRSSTPLQLWRG